MYHKKYRVKMCDNTSEAVTLKIRQQTKFNHLTQPFYFHQSAGNDLSVVDRHHSGGSKLSSIKKTARGKSFLMICCFISDVKLVIISAHNVLTVLLTRTKKNIHLGDNS